jgi:hypothetical protein
MKIRAVLFAALAATLTLQAALGADPTPPYDLSHTVPVQVGKATLQDGDDIVIDSIHGPADMISAGNVYRVDGRYKLASHAEAKLSISITSSEDPHNDSHAPGRSESMIVDKGDGTFSLYFRMGSSGSAHLSFYPANGGSSFASVYFNGTDPWAKGN